MDTIKNAANSVSETVQGGASQASKEGNKHIAKDGNNDMSTRATAAKDMVGDKLDQKKHETNSNIAQQKADL
ncbi:MAG: hypothetical protein OHK93_004067 [Ramalina farinacea]|uniref:Uncharacterized protein n=1 Tax=Ramalina farinacea TaxID=258253 RepID=A0AA43QG28_9LECA|nr:hypothetical protein [Ramalina farinacea]